MAWGLLGGVLEAVFGLPPGWSGAGIIFQEFVAGFGAFAAIGFLGSGAFSVALGLEGRRRSFAEMSLRRFAIWGAMAGLLAGTTMYLVLSPDMVGRFGLAGALLRVATVVSAMGLLGAGSAAGSLALARKSDDRELLEAGEELADVGLTKEEAQELLGA